jgi:hypothetical protein
MRLCEKPCYYRSTKEVNQMKGLTAICALIVGAVMFTNAQTPTVTNAELEKYRAKRVAAEEELRQKYAEMGFPGPTELERQRNRDYWDKIELGEKLQAQRHEREKLEAERAERERLVRIAAEASIAAAAARQKEVVVERQDDTGYLWGYYILNNRRWPWRSPYPYYYPYPTGSGTYRVGGGMVVAQPGAQVPSYPQRPRRRR